VRSAEAVCARLARSCGELKSTATLMARSECWAGGKGWMDAESPDMSHWHGTSSRRTQGVAPVWVIVGHLGACAQRSPAVQRYSCSSTATPFSRRCVSVELRSRTDLDGDEVTVE